MNRKRTNPIEKHLAEPTKLRLAINAKCYDCMGRDSDPGVVRRIRECEVLGYPLHPVRPYRSRRDAETGSLQPGNGLPGASGTQ